MVESDVNYGVEFDSISDLLVGVNVDAKSLKDYAANIHQQRPVEKRQQVEALLEAVPCIDLTSLCGDDTECNIQRLCHKAEHPLNDTILRYFGRIPEEFHVGAVCVYPCRVNTCVDTLKRLGSEVPIAAVAAGFPSGQYPLQSKLKEIHYCVKEGANEIDIVISRNLVLDGEWKLLYEEVRALREACGDNVNLKTIIAAGELGSYNNIYRASMVCLAGGADFIKTSTGKEVVNATLPIGVVMARAISDYRAETNFMVGFKPAGGIRTVGDVLDWQNMMKIELGPEWLQPNLFRIGASGVLSDIEGSISY